VLGGDEKVKVKAQQQKRAFALTGRERGAWFTQGVALGYGLDGLSGRSVA